MSLGVPVFSREKHSPPVVSVGLQGFFKGPKFEKTLKIAHLLSEGSLLTMKIMIKWDGLGIYLE